MAEKDLVPECALGEEIKERFNELHFRKNPHESPMAKALVLQGYDVQDHPLHGEYTDDDWLASKVSIKGLLIIFRQPTPMDILICRVEREGKEKKMSSPLLGVMEFIAFCHYHCPEVHWLGGCIGKLDDQDSLGNLKMDRLVRYYHRVLGEIEGYNDDKGWFWIYADMRCKKRFETLPIWQRYIREKGDGCQR
ncbi:MAG: hypothetical protein NT164_02450 [Verrucomicrobiae bacterium]|nr:hypothetical protein [Verrucomicrobiae bacterium]